MSSGKLSEAELEKRRQEELERQRQERLRKIREATESYHHLVERYESFSAHLSMAMKNELDTLSGEWELEVARESYLKVKDEVIRDINRQISATLPTDFEDIRALNEKLEWSFTSIEKKYRHGLSEFSKRLSLYYEGKAEIEKSNAFSMRLSELVHEERHDYSRIDFDWQGNVDDADDSVIAQEREKAISECVLLVNNSAIGKSDRSLLVRLLSDMQTVQNAVSMYIVASVKVKQNIRVFNQQYADYCALYIEWAQLQKAAGLTISQESPSPKSAFDSYEDLASEVKRLDTLTKTENERKYIREKIEEVMLRNNYKLAESIILQGSKKGLHFLFDSNSDSSYLPLHMFVSDSNMIMMEPVGIDGLDVDETADYNAKVTGGVEISQEERAWIAKGQKSFCDLHPKIIEELKQLGVIFYNNKVTEAGEKYAKVLRVKGKRSRFKTFQHENRAMHEQAQLKSKGLK